MINIYINIHKLLQNLPGQKEHLHLANISWDPTVVRR